MRYDMNESYLLDDELQETEVIPLSNDNDALEMQPLNDGDILPVLPLRNMVLFPGVLLPVTVARPKSLNLVKIAFKNDKTIAVCCQKNAGTEEPKSEDIYPLGTAARVVRIFELPDGAVTVILEGTERIMIDAIAAQKPYLKAKVFVIPETFPKKNDKSFLAVVSQLKELAVNILKRTEGVPPEAGFALKNIDNPPTLVNYICVNFSLSVEQKQALLQQEKLEERALQLLEMLNKEQQLLDIKQSIQQKAQKDIDKQQRDYFLQQQIHTIQKELGDTSEQKATEMREKASKKRWSQEVAEVFEKELRKLEAMPSHAADYSVQLNYLETMLNLPWNEFTEDHFDIRNAQTILDRDHYGMDKVKERILEFLSVLKMKSLESQKLRNSEAQNVRTSKAPILCLYGPPGVGKTSLGKSIAEALGRKYARISLGGLHDESEIRGHRRTYIGAMPGRIIQNLQKVQSSNPVFVLDEIDKLASDYHGDPTSALLEVLDPEQNTTFHDNFLDVDYDLSKVLFIATANSLSSIPRPLLDRMELIEMTGYLQEEKVEIAKRHLVPKQLEEHGINSKQLRFNKGILEQLIDSYTRESGVRELDRQIATVVRKVVRKIAMDEPYNISIKKEDLQTYLGKPRFTRDIYENNKYVGVVTGLAWTQVGGEILFIETALSNSKTPTLILTGNLGDVMKESATIALGYIKAHADELGIAQDKLETSAVHLHVPEGAIPKDGPSAGITMTTALVSAFTGKLVRERLAMTGEMTLRGKVLPVGGIKEKILAAKRAGITDIMLCADNQKDIDEIPEMYRKGLTFHYVNDIHEVLAFALL